MKHYKEKLSTFINHKLANDERQLIGEHLLQCADCRAEHDKIKFGAALASQLKQSDAPESLWNKIENALDGKEEKAKTSLIPNFVFSDSRAFAAMSGLLLIGGLMSAVYFGFLRNNSPEVVRSEQTANVEISRVSSASDETSANRNTNATVLENVNSTISIQPQISNSNADILPKISPIEPKETIAAQNKPTSWNVETLAGMPKVGNSFENGKLAVGQFLETDANSRARVQVANIGQVEIEPNSRVQLVNSNSNEHRLSLEKGILQAKILAPPRLFIVDTPSAVAVDLGCEYTLEVDKDGNAKLHVTSGLVALERGGRESIIPAGAIALTRRGKSVGTPFAENSSAELQNALYKFDFSDSGSQALQTIIKESNVYDSLTLWHLLSRVPKNERGKVFDALANLVKPPANVTREGVLRSDKKMLDAWWTEVENVWFG